MAWFADAHGSPAPFLVNTEEGWMGGGGCEDGRGSEMGGGRGKLWLGCQLYKLI